jgi:pantothenate kinase type III
MSIKTRCLIKLTHYAIDLGNTALKVLCQHPETQQVERLHHWLLADFGVEPLAQKLQLWRNTLSPEAFVAWVSTNPTIEASLFQYLNTADYVPLNKHHLLNDSTNGGINFTYYQASWDTIGIDRVLNVLQLASKFPTETSVLINAGSATTIDILINGKTYGGGAILPSVASWQQALPQQAPHLPLPLQLNATDSFHPPTSTQEAITHGNNYPYAMGILAYAQQLAHYWESPITQIVVTGGYSAWLHHALEASLKLGFFTPSQPSLILDKHWYNNAIFTQLKDENN